MVSNSQVGDPLIGHRYGVNAVAAMEVDGRPLALTGGGDDMVRGMVRVWDLLSQREVGDPLIGHTLSVNAVATSEVDGNPLAVTGSLDGTVRVWDLLSRRQVGEPLMRHAGRDPMVATTNLNGRALALFAGEDPTVRVWDLASKTCLPTLQLAERPKCAVTALDSTVVLGMGYEVIALKMRPDFRRRT